MRRVCFEMEKRDACGKKGTDLFFGKKGSDLFDLINPAHFFVDK